jgi:immune inhibitor A
MAERHAVRERLSLTHRAAAQKLGIDTVYVPILLGRYSDTEEKYTNQEFQELLFDGPNHTGTVTDYFLETSYGQLLFTGFAEGWFSAPRGAWYYVNDGNNGVAYGGRDFTIDILARADTTVDFAQYVTYFDAQGMGHVPQLGIVHTGADAAAGANNIWSHRWNIRGRLLERKLAGSDPYFDVSRVTPEGWYITDDLTSTGQPVVIDGDYAIHPELEGRSNENGSIVAIGVFAHEFGHIFGLPDLYDTDNSSEGVGNWCLMAGGSWGGNGHSPWYPSHMSAWCKERMGWVTPTVVTAFEKRQPIRNAEEYPDIFKLWKLGASGPEYFLIENRQKVGFDQTLEGSGLFIFHIDNTRNNNRNENRYLVDLEQADGNRDLNNGSNRGDGGDPYPGLSDNRGFEPLSVPNSNEYAGGSTYVGVRNISNSDLTMTADLGVGTRPFVLLEGMEIVEGSVGNGNGRVEPNETGSLQIQLQNLNPAVGTDMGFAASTDAEGASAETDTSFSIDALGQSSIFIQDFLSVGPAFEPREILLQSTVHDDQDTVRFQSPLVLGYPEILIVDRDTTEDNAAAYFRSAVEAYGAHHETLRMKGESLLPAALEKRRIVVWLTGRRTKENIPDSAQGELRTHLAAGGHLFVSGQNVAEDLQAEGSPFLSEVLHAQWTRNVALGRIAYGIPDDFFGSQFTKLYLAGDGGASNQLSPDELTPDSLAHPAMKYNSTSGSSYAAVWHETPSSGGKMIFMGFGFEAINDSTSSATRDEILAGIFNWFNGITSTPDADEHSGLPATYRLVQNYPNPFNPSTRIEFTLPLQSQVTISVYNILGQQVSVLAEGKWEAGHHTLTWNGGDDVGGQLASGVYFYRMEAIPTQTSASPFVSVRKMTLLR